MLDEDQSSQCSCLTLSGDQNLVPYIHTVLLPPVYVWRLAFIGVDIEIFTKVNFGQDDRKYTFPEIGTKIERNADKHFQWLGRF